MTELFILPLPLRFRHSRSWLYRLGDRSGLSRLGGTIGWWIWAEDGPWADVSARSSGVIGSREVLWCIGHSMVGGGGVVGGGNTVIGWRYDTPREYSC